MPTGFKPRRHLVKMCRNGAGRERDARNCGGRPGRLKMTEEEQEFSLSWRGQEGKSARHTREARVVRMMEGFY